VAAAEFELGEPLPDGHRSQPQDLDLQRHSLWLQTKDHLSARAVTLSAATEPQVWASGTLFTATAHKFWARGDTLHGHRAQEFRFLNFWSVRFDIQVLTT
jgi:hypothetical protein